MPLLTLQTSVRLSNQQRHELLSPLSKVIADGIGKSERYVMVIVSEQVMMMAGNDQPAAFVDIRSIGGLNREVNRKLSEGVCRVLQERLGISSDRVYLGFNNVSAENWGWDSGTFG